MASVPILDPKTIDTAQTAVTKEEILELNAQREEFEQVDRLISLDLDAGAHSRAADHARGAHDRDGGPD